MILFITVVVMVVTCGPAPPMIAALGMISPTRKQTFLRVFSGSATGAGIGTRQVWSLLYHQFLGALWKVWGSSLTASEKLLIRK